MNDIDAIIQGDDATIIDARPNQRFLGVMPEPRPNMSAGHIPTSHNVPASVLVDRETGKLLSKEKLADLFMPLQLPPESRIVTSCGSGVTACVDAFALHLLGFRHVAVYDGSWSEWGQIGSGKPFVKN